MHTTRIKIGNVIAEVISKHTYVRRICEPYVTDEDPNFSIMIDEHAIEEVRTFAEIAKNPVDMIPEDTEDWFLEIYVLLQKLLSFLPKYDMLYIHGSAIVYDGKAYIFVAPSGTGKSTHTRMWQERFGNAVTVLNDDKPFLAFRNGSIFVCGTPWRGKHNLGQNLEAELGGICIINRSEENRIIRVKPFDAVQEIIQQCGFHRYNNNAPLALDLVDKLLSITPVYRLFCTPTLEAAEICCKAITK